MNIQKMFFVATVIVALFFTNTMNVNAQTTCWTDVWKENPSITPYKNEGKIINDYVYEIANVYYSYSQVQMFDSSGLIMATVIDSNISLLGEVYELHRVNDTSMIAFCLRGVKLLDKFLQVEWEYSYAAYGDLDLFHNDGIGFNQNKLTNVFSTDTSIIVGSVHKSNGVYATNFVVFDYDGSVKSDHTTFGGLLEEPIIFRRENYIDVFSSNEDTMSLGTHSINNLDYEFPNPLFGLWGQSNFVVNNLSLTLHGQFESLLGVNQRGHNNSYQNIYMSYSDTNGYEHFLIQNLILQLPIGLVSSYYDSTKVLNRKPYVKIHNGIIYLMYSDGNLRIVDQGFSIPAFDYNVISAGVTALTTPEITFMDSTFIVTYQVGSDFHIQERRYDDTTVVCAEIWTDEYLHIKRYSENMLMFWGNDAAPIAGSSVIGMKQRYVPMMTDVEEVETETIEFAIKAYPNPTYGDVTVDLGEESIDYRIRIADVSGRILNQLEGYDSTVQIELRDYPTGVYFVAVVIGKQIETVRIVKQ